MSGAMATLESVLVTGDLSKLGPADRIAYYKARCEAAGLDPRSQPFQYLTLNNRLVLYATKACTDQLTGLHKLSVSVSAPQIDREAGICVVTCRVGFPDSRHVEDMGAVPIMGLKGEALCNALLKATTKAKRRAILSACGLGMLDETEVDSIPEARPVAAPQRPALEASRQDEPEGLGRPPYGTGAPQTGKQLFQWIKDHEKAHGAGLLKHVNAWGKAQGLPFKMLDWNAAAIPHAWEVVMDFVGEPADDSPDADPEFESQEPPESGHREPPDDEAEDDIPF